ncbi:hypothetical protein [Chamaesiphon sp. VAR_48_metabat_135_sub]|uniref:hypothetical protein n=1 Tax=Chamaesiphon sp. VAR_48_metabat_135_sub TaxID=2964699 RepID=UPI00286C89A7|nr:hypothetical protein [Chamaesiphon sp. VAR_48_metabat_135_sub]
MPKLILATLTVMFATAGVGFSQSATATQVRWGSLPFGKSARISTILHENGLTKYRPTISLVVKKCTMKRYRRPH